MGIDFQMGTARTIPGYLPPPYSDPLRPRYTTTHICICTYMWIYVEVYVYIYTYTLCMCPPLMSEAKHMPCTWKNHPQLPGSPKWYKECLWVALLPPYCSEGFYPATYIWIRVSVRYDTGWSLQSHWHFHAWWFQESLGMDLLGIMRAKPCTFNQSPSQTGHFAKMPIC